MLGLYQHWLPRFTKQSDPKDKAIKRVLAIDFWYWKSNEMDFLRVCSMGTKRYYFRAAKRLWMIRTPYFAVMGQNITSLDFSLSIPYSWILLIETKEGIIEECQKTRNLLKSGLYGTSLERPSLHSLLSLINLKRTGFTSLWLCYILLSPKAECSSNGAGVLSIHSYILSTQNCGWSPVMHKNNCWMNGQEWMNEMKSAAIRGKKE